MSRRSQGLILIAVGLVGLTLTSIGWGAGPMGAWSMMGPGSMSQMHGWMEGSDQQGRSAPAPSPGATAIRVVARDFSFSPPELDIPAGRTVNVTLVNEGDLFHDITIPALGFGLSASPRTSASGALTPPRPGTYEFFCSVQGHREAGMSGTLVVP